MSGSPLASRGRAAEAPRRAPLAANLRAGLAELAQAMPTDLRTAQDVEAYRRAGAARTTTAPAVAERLGLAWRESDAVDGCPITVFSPRERGAARPAARVLFLHGGGMIAGCRFDGVDVLARHAAALDLEVWTLEYPLAPEHRMPDMITTVLGVLTAMDDADRADVPIILSGQSGGGGLAAASALHARGRGIRVDAQLLVCPMLDRTDTASARQFGDSPAWSAVSHRTAWQMVLAGTDLLPPGEREDLEGLPPTFLDVGAAELFRDSVLAFAGRLAAAGVRAELHMHSGAFHGSDCVVEDAQVSKDAHAARASWLARVLRGEV
ncbi:alpha/beta hydrolase [Brachybacterium subflavum]|uniref:alpha/beta hydrolase n=1 Tax=Brachybacterium subflavum TaxID=2585206 RepID=UPI001266386B|nr:alpha/beta hydrolase fold domain-containing protein [Brachybacterium subflavum]